MNIDDNTPIENLPKAKVSPINSVSSIWLIPLIALIIGAWMVVDSYRQEGPLITIAFSTAQGIEVNQSMIKLRDIPVGKVIGMKLNDKLNGVILTVRLKKNTESLLSKDSLFWVVKPRIGLGSISGLSTILSGAYIELEAGKSTETTDHFVGLESPPLTPAGTPGLHLTLDSNSDHAFNIGDPVLFRGSKVGRIEYVHFNTDERKFYYNAFIDAPYDQLITTNTRFWEVKGVEIDITSQGLKFNTGTLETFLDGGVAFDVPTYLPKGEKITDRAYFSIYPNKEKVNEQLFQATQNYVLLFNQSVRGLKPGNSVEYKGIKVGEVVRTDIDYPEINNFLAKNTLLPVMIKLAPGRLGLPDNEIGLDKLQREMSQWISQGLHGVISIDNLVMGSKYIELKYTNASDYEASTFGDVLIIPTADGELQQLFSRVQEVATKIEELPLNNLLTNANGALVSITAAMKNFNAASTDFSTLLSRTDIQALVSQANASLKSVEQLTNSYTQGSQSNVQLNKVLQAIEKAVQSLNPLLLQIKMQPNSLVMPIRKQEEKIPMGVK
jgi:paraquat-inducible protein B